MYGPCLSAIVGGHALTPPTRRRLGRPLPHQLADKCRAAPPPSLRTLILRPHAVLPRLSTSCPTVKGTFPASTHPSATDLFFSCENYFSVRLACLRHAASVHPEPGSNSQKN